MCELEPNCRRAPRASLEAQRFRYLQKVNDLEIKCRNGMIVALSPEQRSTLIEALETHAERTFDQIRTLLKLKTPKGSEDKYTFNLEAGGEKKLKGNATAAKLRKVLGDHYDTLTPEQLCRIVDDLLEYEKKDALARRLVKLYGLKPEQADALADVTLEDGYASFSREAIRKLLPLMEQGMRFATAREQVYGAYAGRAGLHDFLPPVLDAVTQLRNPVVCRGLTELRKVVNALIREYGKPKLIRVELARDLKRSRTQREDLTKQMRQNEKAREEAKRKIMEKMGISDPRPGDGLEGSACRRVQLGMSLHGQVNHHGVASWADAAIRHRTHHPVQPVAGQFVREQDALRRERKPRREAESNASRSLFGERKEVAGDSCPRAAVSRLGRPRQTAQVPAKRIGRGFCREDAARHSLHVASGHRVSGLALRRRRSTPDGRRRVQVSAGRITAYLRDEWGLNAFWPTAMRTKRTAATTAITPSMRPSSR